MRSLPKDQLLLIAAAVAIVGVVVAVATDHLGTALIFVAVLQGIIGALVMLVLRVQRHLRVVADQRSAAFRLETEAWQKGIDRTLANIGELVVTESQATLRELRD